RPARRPAGPHPARRDHRGRRTRRGARAGVDPEVHPMIEVEAPRDSGVGASAVGTDSPFASNTWRRIRMFLVILGPGMITANVDNDAGGITTYSLAGAHFGLDLMWTMLPIAIALIVTQEACARMGVITGKGLADLIREEYGVKATFWVMLALVLTNLA